MVGWCLQIAMVGEYGVNINWLIHWNENWNISLEYLSIKQIAGIQWVQTNYNGIEHDGIIMEYY